MIVDVHNLSSGIPRIKGVVFASLSCISADVHIQVHIVEHNHTTIDRKNLFVHIRYTTHVSQECAGR